MSFEGFQDGRHHLGYQNRTILAVLNLCVSVMPPIKFQLNWTYGLGGMLFEEFQDGHLGSHLGYRNGTILAILNLCHCDASHQVSAQSDLRFGRRCRLKNFKMATVAAILDNRTEQF